MIARIVRIKEAQVQESTPAQAQLINKLRSSAATNFNRRQCTADCYGLIHPVQLAKKAERDDGFSGRESDVRKSPGPRIAGKRRRNVAKVKLVSKRQRKRLPSVQRAYIVLHTVCSGAVRVTISKCPILHRPIIIVRKYNSEGIGRGGGGRISECVVAGRTTWTSKRWQQVNK